MRATTMPNPNDAQPPTFAALTPPMTSALSVWRLNCSPSQLPITQGVIPTSPNERPRLVELAGVDQGLLGLSPDHSYWFTPHGGPGVADAITRALTKHGFRESTAPHADPDFASALGGTTTQPLNRYRQTALSMLHDAPSPAAAKMLVAALNAPPPDPSDESFGRRMLAAWPSVAPYFMRPLVVLVGAPNAGKSSLFNRLVDDAEAIVSSEPGTTRDVVTGLWTLPNQAVVELADMPGIRADSEVDSPGERAGIAIAREWMARAAIRLVLAPCNVEDEPDEEGLHIGTKCDLFAPPSWADHWISSETGDGLDILAEAVMGHLFREPPHALIPLSGEMALDMIKPNALERWFGASQAVIEWPRQSHKPG